MDQQGKKYREPKDTLWGKCLTTFIAIVFAVSTLTIIPLAGALDNPANEQADAAAAAAAKEAANEAEGKTGATLTEETPKPIENLINEDKKGETLDTVENVLGVQSADEEDAPSAMNEVVPAEVQAFLDAVAAIPEITPENAAEVAEYVYGPVSEAYEVLLGTDFMERPDVQQAEAIYGQVIASIDAVMNIESTDYWYQGKTINAGTVTKHVGDSGFYQRLPRLTFKHNVWYCGAVVAEYIPGYDYDADSWTDDEFLSNIQLKNGGSYKGGSQSGDNAYIGYPCFEFNYTAIKPTKETKVDIDLYYCYNAPAEYGRCGSCGNTVSTPSNYNTYKDDINFSVKIVADYVLNFETNGGNKINPMYATEASDTAYFVLPTPVRDGYTFDGWYKDQSLTEKAGDAGHNYGVWWVTGKGSVNDPVTATLYAKWTPNKTYTVTYTDGVAGATVFPDQGYEGLKEGDNTPAFIGTPSREGYTFQGWSPAVNPVVSADDADENGEIVYTATWKKNLKDLTVSKSPSEEYPIVGEEFSYTITVTNPNSDEIKVKITDVLNEKLDFVAAGDGGTYDSATRTVTWTNVTVPASGSKNVTVYVKANAAGEIYNEAQIECDINTTSGNTTVTAKNPDPVSTTYTIIHEYYTNGERDGFTKQENISGKNVGDVVKVDDIDKVLKYTKNGVENTYAYTQANKGTANNSPNGYTIGDVITELTLGKDGNIIVLRYDRNVTPPVTPSLSSLQKQRLTEAPDGVTVPAGINYDNTVVFVGDNASICTPRATSSMPSNTGVTRYST